MILDFIAWLENHPVTVELIQWVLLLVVAWTTGVLRYVRELLRRPFLEIWESQSRCFGYEIDGSTTLGFVIDVEAVNPTNHVFNIRKFEFQFYRKGVQSMKSEWLNAMTLPSRPRVQMGDKVKMLRVFFSRFSGDAEGDPHSGLIEPRSSSEGFVFFCCKISGSMERIVIDNEVEGEIRVSLSTGEKLRARCRVPHTTDEIFLQSWVPGIKDQTIREAKKARDY